MRDDREECEMTEKGMQDDREMRDDREEYAWCWGGEYGMTVLGVQGGGKKVL